MHDIVWGKTILTLCDEFGFFMRHASSKVQKKPMSDERYINLTFAYVLYLPDIAFLSKCSRNGG